MEKSYEESGHRSGDWDPISYWNDYYSGPEMPDDEYAMFAFCVETLEGQARNYAKMIDVGCGPTIHRLIPFAPYVDQMDVCDYEQSNLDCVEKWRVSQEGALSWDKFFDLTWQLERGRFGDPDLRKSSLRRALRHIMRGDVRSPICDLRGGDYDVVTTFLCLESVSPDKDCWQEYLENVLQLLRPGGRLFMATLINTKQYRLEKKTIGCCDLAEGEVLQAMRRSLVEDSISSRRISLKGIDIATYDVLGDILVVSGIKK